MVSCVPSTGGMQYMLHFTPHQLEPSWLDTFHFYGRMQQKKITRLYSPRSFRLAIASANASALPTCPGTVVFIHEAVT